MGGLHGSPSTGEVSMDLFRQPEQDPAHVPSLRDLLGKMSVMAQPAATTPWGYRMGRWGHVEPLLKRPVRWGKKDK
jgi:hypothetical protein